MGTWTSEASEGERYERREVSFSIPLAAPLEAGHGVFVSAEEQTMKSGTDYGDCGGSVEEPKAKEGYLCVYQGFTENPEKGEFAVGDINEPSESGGGGTAGVAGAIIVIAYEPTKTEPPGEEHSMQGSWAVSAP